VSRELGKVQPVTKEVERLRLALSNFTHVKYKVKEPESDFPPPSSGVKWYLTLDDWRDSKRAEYAASLWEDGVGTVWIQSAGLGDLAELVFEENGKQSYAKFRELDLERFESPNVRKEFAKLFPDLGAYLSKCDESARSVGLKNGVNLKMKFEGGSDENVGEHVLFWMTTRIDAKGLDLQKKLERIELGVSAIKEALERAGGGKWPPPLNS
jgi:hypothetical protein